MKLHIAALNKTATTQADVLVIHRTTGPQDRRALNDWIAEHHASTEERDAFLRALPELKTGEAFVWAPDFPEDHPLGLQRTKIEGGAFGGYVRELRALGFVVSDKTTARAADALFLESVR